MQLKQLYRLAAIGCIAMLVHIQAISQEDAKTADTPTIITLSAAQLKPFEGVFQNAQNKEMNVQFSVDSNSLKAKLLWNQNQLRLYPQSELAFFSKEGERVNITFVKAADGTITQVNVGGNGLWNRVKDYKPITKQEAPHTPAQLKLYEGLFKNEHNDNLYLQFTEKDNNLLMKQQWDGQELQLVPDSNWIFFNKQQQMFTLDFTKGSDGQITKVMAFRREIWNKVKPAHYAPNDLKAFEGKYQLKVDNDDVIQITATGGNLAIKQLWDGKETIVAPLADNYFYGTTEAYPIKFDKNADGTVTGATALDGDAFEKIK